MPAEWGLSGNKRSTNRGVLLHATVCTSECESRLVRSGLRERDRRIQCKVRGLREMRLLHLQLRREEAEVELEDDDGSPNTGRSINSMCRRVMYLRYWGVIAAPVILIIHANKPTQLSRTHHSLTRLSVYASE